MKRLVLLLALAPASALAAPFLVSDPAPAGQGIDVCAYIDGSGAQVDTPLAVVAPQTAPGCKIDLAGFSAGAHNLQLSFKSTLFGTESAKVPFVFTKPAAGGTGPASVRIVP